MSFCDDDEEINDWNGVYSDPKDKQMCEWERRNKQQWTTVIGGHRYTLKELREAL
jgi:hypothetical protein